MKYITTFFLIGILAFACQKPAQQTPSVNNNHLISSFLKAKQLDKRTTLFQEVEENDETVLLVENEDLKFRFIKYALEHGKTYSNGIAVVSEPEIAYVANSVANVRSAPKHSAELSTQYLMGQKLNIFRQQGSWYLVQGPDDYIGWVDAGGIVHGDAISKEWLNATKQMVYSNESVAYKDKDFLQPASDLVFGNKVGLVNNNYILPNGQVVFIQEDTIFSAPTNKDKVELVLDKAYSLLGRPYLWGGTSTKGLDCSGFTRTAFMNAGYLLGRDASLQVLEGEEINKSDFSKWQPGDLLFFGSYRKDGSMRVTHVAIHTGDGAFIHSARNVNEQSLNPNHENFSQDRADEFLAVRRIIRN